MISFMPGIVLEMSSESGEHGLAASRGDSRASELRRLFRPQNFGSSRYLYHLVFFRTFGTNGYGRRSLRTQKTLPNGMEIWKRGNGSKGTRNGRAVIGETKNLDVEP